MFTVLSSSIVNASNQTKWVLLSNQKCESNQEIHYYPFSVKLDRCFGSCNTVNDLFNKACISNKTEDLNLSVFNITAAINESKTLTKHFSCECKCRFDGKKM